MDGRVAKLKSIESTEVCSEHGQLRGEEVGGEGSVGGEVEGEGTGGRGGEESGEVDTLQGGVRGQGHRHGPRTRERTEGKHSAQVALRYAQRVQVDIAGQVQTHFRLVRVDILNLEPLQRLELL